MYHDWDLQDKCTTGFTRKHLPLVSNYSRALKALQDYLQVITTLLVITHEHYLTCTKVSAGISGQSFVSPLKLSSTFMNIPHYF